MTKDDLPKIVEGAIRANGGKATVVEVAEHIWHNFEAELRSSGELFYTWQYDMRWAATRLREQGILISANISPRGVWELVRLETAEA